MSTNTQTQTDLRSEPLCSCSFDSDTGYFNACSEKCEQEYIEYLEAQAKAKEQADGK